MNEKVRCKRNGPREIELENAVVITVIKSGNRIVKRMLLNPALMRHFFIIYYGKFQTKVTLVKNHFLNVMVS